MCIFRKLFILIMILAISVTVAAQENSSEALVGEYIAALKTRDRDKIDLAWLNLNRNADAVAYMKANRPKQFYSYELWGMLMRSRRVQAIEAEAPEATGEIRAEGRARGLRRGGQQDNSSRIDRFNNSDRRSNSRIPRGSANQFRTSNRDIVERSPNRNFRSNQQRIKSRRRR